MAGLCAAARARELGVAATVLEKGDRPGGSMLLSSGVIWRYPSLVDFRLECPNGDPRLQRLIVERLDDSLDWLQSLGAPLVAAETKNPRTVGRRFDPRGLTEALVRAAGDVQTGRGLGPDPETRPEEPLVLATGGFPVRLARERSLAIRSNPWSEGDGLDFALEHGAETAGDMDEFYGRAMPAPPARIGESDYVRLSQLWGGEARVVDESGEEFFPKPPAWHESDLAQAIARRPGGTAWFCVGDEHRDDPRVTGLRDAGGTIVEEYGELCLHVAAAVTHTQGGLRVDETARVVGAEGLFAAGVDVGGIATGGYASGLAVALVLGRVAAESALS